MMLSVGVGNVFAAEDEKTMEGKTVILHTNDTHSRVDDNMGFSAVSALKKAYEADGATVLLMDAGDTLHGLPIANLSSGSYIIDIMNQAGYDVMTPGNHDFNYGYEHLLELAKEMDFPLISANLQYEDGKLVLPANTILEAGGKKFGVFGLSTPETAYKTNPVNVEGLVFGDLVEAAKAQVAELEAAGCDYIVALAHVGVDESSDPTSYDIINAVEGIDIYIDGHSHTELTNEKVGETVLASTGEYISNVGVIVIGTDGKVEESVLVNGEAFTEKDPEVDALVESLKAEVSALLDVVIGKTDVALDGTREVCRTQESNLGNLAADAFIWATKADIALTNGGGIRESIPAGDITKRALNTVFPFGNYVVTVNVTGQQLKDALELGVSGYPATSGGFPQIAGFSFKFDAAQEVGSRVYDVKVGEEPLDLTKTYLLATNNFTAAGGDNYTMLANPIVNEFGALDDVLIGYIESLGTVGEEYAAAQGRIVEAANPDAPVVEKTVEETPAVEPEPTEPAPEVVPEQPAAAAGTYTVVKGDSLWKIAAAQLGNGRLWGKIYEANKDQIKDPAMIQIGQVLAIPQ